MIILSKFLSTLGIGNQTALRALRIKKYHEVSFLLLRGGGEASLTFGHANAKFSVFIDRTGNEFLRKWILIMI